MAQPKVKIDFTAAAKAIEDLYREIDSKAVPSGMRIIGEEIKTDVVATRPGKGVPRDIGNLASSIGVEGPDKKGVVNIFAGGAAAPYALAVHERLDVRHPSGEARYLSRAVERWKPNGSAAHEALKENLDAAVKAVAARSKK